MKKILLSALMLAFATVNAQTGTVDPSFNTGLNVNSWNNPINCVKIQPDGKILIGGEFTNYNTSTSRNYIARVNSNASNDATFNPGTGADGVVKAMELQSDGKIIIIGDFTSYDGNACSRIARINADGSYDATFTVGTGFNATVYSLKLQSDGKILVSGSQTMYNGTSSNHITRLNSDGTLDATFTSGTGLNQSAIPIKIDLQSDGKIIVARNGFMNVSYNGTLTNKIFRLNSDGTHDATFLSGTGPGPIASNVYTFGVDANDKIVVSGSYDLADYDGAALTSGVFRINANGTLDASFASGTGLGGLYPYANTISFTNDGKIYMGGQFSSYNGTTIGSICRLNTDGTLDNSYAAGGGNGPVNQIAIQSDDKIIAVGGFFQYNFMNRYRIVRLLNCTATSLPTAYTMQGATTYCAGSTVEITLDNSETGVSYQLKLNGGLYGGPVSGTGGPLSMGLVQGTGTYTIEATKNSTWCNSDMLNSLDITEINAPTSFAVNGGGTFCSGSNGVNVGLAGSETGVDYQLIIDGTNSGAPIAGTGSAINFGLQTTNGTYTVSAISACSSVMTGNVTVSTITVDGLVSSEDNTITASTSGASYQWVDCNNSNAPISGATSQSFTPTVTGNYAVEVTVNGCTETSNCTQVTIGGGNPSSVNENEVTNFNIYPNPANSTVSVSNVTVGSTVTIIDVMGKRVSSTKAVNTTVELSVEAFSNGIYFIEIENNGAIAQKKLVVSK